MPVEGEIAQAQNIGYAGRAKHIWVICPRCKCRRWVVLGYTKTPQYTQICTHCQARQISYIDGRSLLINMTCVDCGRPLKVPQGKLRRQGYVPLCQFCAPKRKTGSNSHRWKGGKYKGKDGYIYVWVPSDSPYYAMAHGSYIPEHRLVMAKSLGRCLFPWEIVHHINKVKDHNIRKNLKLLPSHSEHRAYTALQERVKTLEQRVTLLEAELILTKEVQREPNQRPE